MKIYSVTIVSFYLLQSYDDSFAEVSLPTDETNNISIADGSGTVKAKGVSNGAAQYRSSVNSLQPGTYYVHITTKEKTEPLKFVKE